MGHDPCHLTASTALICGQSDMTRHCFAHRLIAHVHGLSLASKQISHCTVYCWNKPFICKTRKLPKRYRVHSGVVLRHLRFLGRGVLKDSSSPKLKMFKWWLGGGVKNIIANLSLLKFSVCSLPLPLRRKLIFEMIPFTLLHPAPPPDSHSTR